MVRPGEKGIELNTDWGKRRSFPVFVFSAIETLGGGVTQASAPSVQPGQPVHLFLSSRAASYQIAPPSGSKLTLERGNDGRFIYTQTEAPGSYDVFAEGLEEPVEKFCVNLFSARESDLAVASEINTGGEKIAASSTTIRARQETWRWLLLLGLALLMFEWVVFNKRVFI